MKNKLFGLLAIGLISAPLAASAIPVTWQFDGTTTFTSGGIAGLGVHPGDAFRFSLNFDTSAPLRFCNVDAGGGTRCYYNWDSITFSNIFLGSQGPFNPAFLAGDTGALIVRDNFPAPPGDPSAGALTDGLSFGRDTSDSGGTLHLSVIMRGTVLDIINGTAIPAVPDPRLAALAVSGFDACMDSPGVAAFTCDLGEFNGDVTSVAAAAVPEPATYAMFGLGLVLLASMRRRLQCRFVRRD